MSFLSIILLPLALAVSFGCAGMEAGVFALSRWKIRQQVRKGIRRAKVLNDLLENTENFLWTIVVANTLAGFVAFFLGITLLMTWTSGNRPALVAGLLSEIVLFYLICDFLPKILFRHYPNRLCMAAAIPFRFLHFCLGPLVSLITHFSNAILRWSGGKIYTGQVFSSRGELRQIMQESAQGFSTEEKTMINRVLDLQKFRVGQIASPFSRFPTILSTQTADEIVAMVANHCGYDLPVWQDVEGKRTLVGLLDLKSLLYKTHRGASEPIQGFITSALYFSEDLRLEEALKRLQKSGQRLAIVLGRDRREVGIVGVDDIFKVIFGET